ncbi:creatininase family protein [bacterium]|nr:creatininase family protein [bacterium]
MSFPESPEVRYQMLRPAQIVARREACPAAYIPLGNVEWHGVQNPLGADTLQAEGIAIRAAQKGGGLVMPPLWYFAPDHEMTGYIERGRDAIAREMHLPPENFMLTNDPAQVRTANERYQQMLVDMLLLAETLGFSVGILVAGHYPLIAHAIAAVIQFATLRSHDPARTRRPGLDLIPWACCEPVLRYQLENLAHVGDHGGYWETSNVMAMYPQTVDLAALGPAGEPQVGIGGSRPPHEANAADGRQHIEACADLMIREVKVRIEHPDWFRHAAFTMAQGKWKQDAV